MATKTLIIHTSNYSELQKFAPAFNELHRLMDLKFIFVRQKDNGATFLQKELNSAGLRHLPHEVVRFGPGELPIALEQLGHECDTFFGPQPELMFPSKASKKKKKAPVVKEEKDVEVRYALVCRKCESLIDEKKHMTTHTKALVIVENDSNKTDIEVTYVDKKVNIIDETDVCRLC